MNRMRNVYNIDISNSVDKQKIVKLGGRVLKLCEGVIYGQFFKLPPFRKVLENNVYFRMSMISFKNF